MDKAKTEGPVFAGSLTYRGKTIERKDNRPVDLPQLDDYAAMVDMLRRRVVDTVAVTYDHKQNKMVFLPVGKRDAAR